MIYRNRFWSIQNGLSYNGNIFFRFLRNDKFALNDSVGIR